ncbi:MAG: hypothetical protein CMJ92_06915 [Planctomycetes bacterium]|nr:hypothetical protein [Planctomycetota bacterium]
MELELSSFEPEFELLLFESELSSFEPEFELSSFELEFELSLFEFEYELSLFMFESELSSLISSLGFPPPSFKSIPISAEALGLAVKLNMPRTKQAAKGIDRIELTKILTIVYLFYRRIMEQLGGASC